MIPHHIGTECQRQTHEVTHTHHTTTECLRGKGTPGEEGEQVKSRQAKHSGNVAPHVGTAQAGRFSGGTAVHVSIPERCSESGLAYWIKAHQGKPFIKLWQARLLHAWQGRCYSEVAAAARLLLEGGCREASGPSQRVITGCRPQRPV